MAAPLNNQNALGNKGGGRRKAGDIKQLWALWDGQVKLEDIKVKNTKNGFLFKSGYDAFCYKTLTGDFKAVRALVDKLYPNPRAETDFIDYDDLQYENMRRYTNEELDQIIATSNRLRNSKPRKKTLDI